MQTTTTDVRCRVYRHCNPGMKTRTATPRLQLTTTTIKGQHALAIQRMEEHTGVTDEGQMEHRAAAESQMADGSRLPFVPSTTDLVERPLSHLSQMSAFFLGGASAMGSAAGSSLGDAEAAAGVSDERAQRVQDVDKDNADRKDKDNDTARRTGSRPRATSRSTSRSRSAYSRALHLTPDQG
ncbi:hypothetical protein BDZ97DRAFT_1794914 [Flammula alnicola]|nr:hypothetical protein BDZ97DRAFT_1794914 [Flammula alnicola]